MVVFIFQFELTQPVYHLFILEVKLFAYKLWNVQKVGFALLWLFWGYLAQDLLNMAPGHVVIRVRVHGVKKFH